MIDVDLVTVVPTRDQPEAARDIVAAFADTCAARTLLAIVVDDTDPRAADYARSADLDLIPAAAAGKEDWAEFAERGAGVFSTPSRTMVEALNLGTAAVVANLDPYAVGFMGDDHRPRTPGWDRRYVDELRDLGAGIVYGDELGRGPARPAQAAMTANIVRGLGFVAPPGLDQQYVETFWLDLGTRADCLRFVPDAVIERLHPAAVTGGAGGAHDAERIVYQEYLDTRGAADVARVRALRQGVRA
jgi:hypothetical protein